MKNLPRIRIAHLPTMVEALPRLASALKAPRLYIKRDDQTGLAFGGNKTRKLEFLLAEAQANGARMLITAGADQSNHCRQTAAAAARFGMKCTLVLTIPPGVTKEALDDHSFSGNLLLDKLMGAKIVWVEHSARDPMLQQVFQDAWEGGQRPFMIPYGGSNPTGASAFAYAVQELMMQGTRPDWIVFPSSSGGTQTGLVLGAHLFSPKMKILGISVDEPREVLKKRVAELANETADLLDVTVDFQPADVLVNDDYLGGGYGVVGKSEIEAISLFAQHEGVLLDPVYTGRAAAGLIDLIRKGYFNQQDTVLFWHTGGTPALFANRYAEIV